MLFSVWPSPLPPLSGNHLKGKTNSVAEIFSTQILRFAGRRVRGEFADVIEDGGLRIYRELREFIVAIRPAVIRVVHHCPRTM
jgi:hypothetical protein